MSEVGKLLRGEPVYLSGIVVTIASIVGVKVSSGAVDDWIAVIGPIVLALISRQLVTPAVNPAQPTTIAVKDDDEETPAGQPKVQVPPILTITGQRR